MGTIVATVGLLAVSRGPRLSPQRYDTFLALPTIDVDMERLYKIIICLVTNHSPALTNHPYIKKNLYLAHNNIVTTTS